MAKAQSVQNPSLVESDSHNAGTKKAGITKTPKKSLKETFDEVKTFAINNQQSIIIGTLAVAAIFLLFWPLFSVLPGVWFSEESYYTHGPIVPIFIAIILYDRWPKIKETKIKGVNFALILLAPILYVTWFVMRSGIYAVQSVLLIVILLLTILFVFGWNMARILAVPTVFLAAGLPVFDRLIDAYTPPIQLFSAHMAFKFFSLLPMSTMKINETEMALNSFVLNVEVACSGMKLMLAVVSITCFFAAIAHLKAWKTILLIASSVPIAIGVNCLRIIGVGLIGVTFGSKAAAVFHDTTGYVSLVLCFFILIKYTRLLGWK